MTTKEKQINEALQYLAGVCDWAEKQDGQGFNKFDASFGHDLATQSDLSEEQLQSALKLLQKYRKQIEREGLTLPRLENNKPIKKKVEPRDTDIKINGLLITIDFPGKPNLETREKIKTLDGWRWNPDLTGKPWTVPTKHSIAIIKMFPDAKIEKEVHDFADWLKENGKAKPEKPASVKIEKLNGKVAVYFPDYEGRQERVAKIKTLSERQWSPDTPGKPWVVPTRLLSELMVMFPNAEVDEKTKAALETQKELADLSNKANADFEVEGLGGELMPFQKAGVKFLELANGRAVIADEMGLGKTIQTLAYLQHNPDLRPAIIVVPASLKINWNREADKWLTTNDTIEIINGTKPYTPSGNILIINWDILTYWAEDLIELNPQIVIGDEAHYAKNSKSKRSKAMKMIASEVERVILLTGTPITNRPKEMFPLLNMVAPDAWPNFFRYAKRYCDAYQNNWGWDFNGASNLEELNTKIKPYVVRRMKKDVLKELPAKRRSTVVIEFNQKERAAYFQVVRETQKLIADSRGDPSAAAHLVAIGKLMQAAVKGKLDATKSWVQNFIDGDEKLVVFATHYFVIDALMEEFGDVAVRITGKDSKEARQKAVDDFQNDDNIKLFVGNIKAAGLGLTLTAASNVAFVEFAWTPGDHIQAEDRTHRIGQDESVTVYYLVADSTIEEKMVWLIEQKCRIIDAAIDGDEDISGLNILNELIAEVIKIKTEDD